MSTPVEKPGMPNQWKPIIDIIDINKYELMINIGIRWKSITKKIVSIDLHQLSSILSIFMAHISFFLFRFNFSDKLNGQDISFDRDKRKEIKENFKLLEPFSFD